MAAVLSAAASVRADFASNPDIYRSSAYFLGLNIGEGRLKSNIYLHNYNIGGDGDLDVDVLNELGAFLNELEAGVGVATHQALDQIIHFSVTTFVVTL